MNKARGCSFSEKCKSDEHEMLTFVLGTARWGCTLDLTRDYHCWTAYDVFIKSKTIRASSRQPPPPLLLICIR